jgi:hypothetical protein
MNSKMKSAKKASPLAVIVFVVSWILVGCSSAGGVQTAAHAQPAATASTHKTTAADLAKRYHGKHVVIENVGPVPNADGLTSQVHFMRHGMLYQADVFVSPKAKAVYFKRLKLYGFTPRWESSTWGIWPVKSEG